MIAQRRRQELADNDRDHQTGLGRGPSPGGQQRRGSQRFRRQLNCCGNPIGRSSQMGHRARRAVAAGGIRPTQATEQVDICSPYARSCDSGGRHGCRCRNDRRRPHCPISPGGQCPDAHERGLDLDEGADCGGHTDGRGSVHPAPCGGKPEEEERLHLAELDSVEQRPVDGSHDDHQPADVAPNRQQSDAGQEARRHGHAPEPGRRSPKEQPRDECHGEGRRVRVSPGASPDQYREGAVVDGLAVQEMARSALVARVVVTERPGRGRGR